MSIFSATKALVSHLRDPQFAREWLLAGAIAEARGRAPAVALHEALPGIEAVAVEMGAVRFDPFNMDPLERFVIGAVCCLYAPRLIFEFGTFNGATTLTLAQNASAARILTLDVRPIPGSRSAVAARGLKPHDMVFFETPEAPRITQLFRDDPGFDFAQWEGTIDLVVIDAGHSYEDVKEDIAEARRLLTDRGIIIWDDYTPTWSGVIRAVDESGLDVITIEGTALAIHLPSRKDGRLSASARS